jgi:hypothetical protein
MILTNPNPEQLLALQSTGGPSRPLPLGSAAELNHETCRRHLDQVVRQIESPAIREIVFAVFQDLSRLLECLDLVESHLRHVDSAVDTFAFFQLIHDEARALVNFIRTGALDTSIMGEELVDTLDGIAFAVHHDLQRVFDGVPRESFEGKPAQVVVGKLYRAHDVLTNCLQQSTITLAMVFDPELVGAKLFNNSDIRYRQSLQLCHELSELIELVENSERIGSTLILTNRIERFRLESMECLMYSDWPQFESFCERVDSAKTQSCELETVLHQFRCYLETLLGQVRMRNVLADVFPLGIGEEANCGVLTTLAGNSTSFDLFHPQHEDVVWREVAFA